MPFASASPPPRRRAGCCGKSGRGFPELPSRTSPTIRPTRTTRRAPTTSPIFLRRPSTSTMITASECTASFFRRRRAATRSGFQATTTPLCFLARMRLRRMYRRSPTCPVGPLPENGPGTPSNNPLPLVWLPGADIISRRCKRKAVAATTWPSCGSFPTARWRSQFPRAACCPGARRSRRRLSRNSQPTPPSSRASRPLSPSASATLIRSLISGGAVARTFPAPIMPSTPFPPQSWATTARNSVVT